MLLGSVRFIRLVQEEKAKAPMLVTLPPNTTPFRLEQDENASLPMPVTVSGRVILVRLTQDENADSPMLMTPTGIVTLVRFVRLANAEAPMLVTGRAFVAEGKTVTGMIVAGMITSPSEPVYKVIMRFVPPEFVV